ncbi:hypothetical protein [Deinococcus hopiensis]|uniref:GDSL-like Lipase/Acylhydrolase n=1 Tax=Deinococcus hopiensis KR-140 TaxID=695939 RepID=A0A1W1U9Q7_9DEIO|nr:hypothetical protein [Deinococcus hopiensis]SMB77772.1 GDSL-like Lipase/Acylhydrolase [Deinococcus hopiensis KR-140]
MKLFTIGDSISQGYMSLSAARTDLSFSNLIARKLGLNIGYCQSPINNLDYTYPFWPENGIGINIEAILRRLNQRYGSNIKGLEWLTVLQEINSVLDASEDYYERGGGAHYQQYENGNVEYFNNISIFGMRISDAWLLTPKICQSEIKTGSRDGFLSGSDYFWYRTALKVLNPSLSLVHYQKTPLDWLEYHSKREGVENLVLWLGANHALGTVISLSVNQTPDLPNIEGMPYYERRNKKWNLWHPNDFKREYEELINRTVEAIGNNNGQHCRIFLATIPIVTIAPLIRGVGEKYNIEVTDHMDQKIEYTYYKYYTYFPFDEQTAIDTGKYLTVSDAIHIDRCIRQFNRIIVEIVKNFQHTNITLHLVDIADYLEKLAWKRNNANPRSNLPDALEFIYPPINTKYYDVNPDGRMIQGGIFSLDGVHPTAIGQGLLAWKFLEAMRVAGVADINNNLVDEELNWPEIISNDTLYSSPLSSMQDMLRKAELAGHILGAIERLRR